MAQFLSTSIRALLFVAGISLLVCGLAAKGFFHRPEYRNQRFVAGMGLVCAILVLLLAAAITGGFFETVTGILAVVVEPGRQIGRNLNNLIPLHRQAIQTIGAALILVLTPLLLMLKKKRALPLLLLLHSGGLALIGGVFLSRREVNPAFFFLFLAAVCLWCSGLVSRSPLAPPSRKNTPARDAAVLLVLIIVIAFILRIYRLGQVSFRFDSNEAGYGLFALRMMENPETALPLWRATAWRGLEHRDFSPVYAWNVVWFFRLFSPGLVTLKMVPVFYGLLAVGLTFGIVQLLFGRRLALLSAFFLAVSPMHVNYSRVGLLLSSTLTVGLAVIYLFFKAILRGKIPAYILLAVVAAFAGYYYSPVKFPLLVCAVLFLVFSIARRGFFIRNFAGLAAFLVAVTLFTAAFNIPAWDLMAPSFAGIESVWHRSLNHLYMPEADYIRAIPLVRENLVKLFNCFFLERNFNYDPWPKGNLYFHPVVSILALLGIAYSLSQFKNPAYRLLLFFAAVFLLPNLLSRPPVITRRTMYAWPFIFCLAAIPVSQLLKKSSELFAWPIRTTITAVVLAGLLSLGSVESHVFFDSNQPAGFWEKDRYFTEAARRLIGEYHLYLLPATHESKPMADFILGEEVRKNPKARGWCYIDAGPLFQLQRNDIASFLPAAVIAAPARTRRAKMVNLQRRLQAREVEEIRDRCNNLIAFVFKIDAEEPTAGSMMPQTEISEP